MMLRVVAPPFIQGRFASLIEGYFVRLNRRLGLKATRAASAS
jgi:hypothetical protein